MTRKRRIFDIDLPDEAPETFPAGKVSDPPVRRGPMAAAIAETADATRDRAAIEQAIRAENDELAHEHVRLRNMGLIADLIPLDSVVMHKLVRDRHKGEDFEMKDLKSSIADLGLSNPIRVERRDDGTFDLIQGYRRLTAFRELLAETGEADRYATIPALVSLPGEGLADLYRRMVDENLVRKDISFAEMAALAIDFSADPETGVSDPERAVAVLYRSAGYQKRSYIRAFLPVVERLGAHLRFAPEIPRALGLALSTRLEQDPDLPFRLREALVGWDNRGVKDEMDILRKLAGADADDTPAVPFVTEEAKTPAPARAKTSFQFDRAGGRGKCVAAVGKLEIHIARDFTTIDRRRLEACVRDFLTNLDR